ncbi:MAG: tetratricopeptide repeat protein, partial [Rhodoferax sp.]|nr:tetratricopeptide repeat protein [Rhodoferax sp.]
MSPDILFALAVTLIPVAAMSGWYYRGHARGKSQSSRERLQGQLARNYLDGLRFLLDDKPDRAIETFLRTLEVDEDTIETHFALANLFRRRGEVSRAIRIHQNLISRAGLSTEQRITAVRELAIDYYRAGLLDRAEVLFRELLDTGPRHNEDLKYLLDIYRQERDWDKAVEIAGLLQQARVSGMEREHAHLLCEQAAEGGVDGALHDARDLLEQALIIDHRCVRARLMLAGLERNAGQYRRAIRHLEQVVTQDRAFVPEILEPLVACYQALGRTDELHAYLAE